MINYNIRNFHPEDAYAMIELQHRCVDICPDTGKFEAGMWLSPGYGNGKNIFIAKDANAQIMGYASTTSAYYSNKWEARIFWMDLRSDPEIDQDLAIKDALLGRILTRGREIKREENRKRAAVGATYFAQGQASIDYLKSRGFTHFESMLAMRKELRDETLPKFDLADDFEVKPWRMESRGEKVAYLAARKSAFGHPLGRLDLLEHFAKSDLWQGGTTFTAFSGGEIIASVMALSNGLLDYVFVIPEWRGKGIAKVLISEALKFLQERNHTQVWLEVYSHNEAAVNLYQSFRFETFKEEISLGCLLD
jgi:GNAT superfamily N-acetyltransferase